MKTYKFYSSGQLEFRRLCIIRDDNRCVFCDNNDIEKLKASHVITYKDKNHSSKKKLFELSEKSVILLMVKIQLMGSLHVHY